MDKNTLHKMIWISSISSAVLGLAIVVGLLVKSHKKVEAVIDDITDFEDDEDE